MIRYIFTVEDFHLVPPAGLPAHPTTTSLIERPIMVLPLAIVILLGECAIARSGCSLLSGDVARHQ